MQQMFKNLPQMISNMTGGNGGINNMLGGMMNGAGGGNPMEMMMKMMVQQNPQIKNMMQTFANITPDQAKQKVQEMAKSGQINKSQLDQFYSFAEQLGVPKESLKEFENIEVKEKQQNRW